MSTLGIEGRHPNLVRAAAFRALLLAGLWWVLTEGAPSSWIIGAPVIAVIVAASMMARPGTPVRLRLAGLLNFLPYFVWMSVLGAADVARRVYGPQLILNPGFVNYPIRLSTEPARVFFANTVSLLPGTLSAELRDDELVVHALDTNRSVERDLAVLEDKVAALFGPVADLAGKP